MLNLLLKTIEFPEELNFNLQNEIIFNDNYHDIIEFESRTFIGLIYIQNWAYRADKNGNWVCLDINIKKAELDRVIIEINKLLKMFNQNIINTLDFNSPNYNHNPSRYNFSDGTRIDFIKINSTLSIQIVKFQPYL